MIITVRHLEKYGISYLANFKSGVNSVIRGLGDCAHSIVYIDSHANVSEIPKNIVSSYRFTFVRNPWDKLVSIYHASKQSDHSLYESLVQSFSGLDKPHYDTFDHFVNNVCSVDDKSNAHYASSYRLQFVALTPPLHFTGRLESAKEDWKIIQKITGGRALPHTNKSEHKPYREYYTDELRDMVAEKYKKDILKFGYEYDMPKVTKLFI